MDYYPPRNTTPTNDDPRPAYFDGNAAAAQKGAIPPALSIEHPQREIVTVIEKAGLVPSAADYTQLYQAIEILIKEYVEQRLTTVNQPTSGTTEPAGDSGYVAPEAGGVTLVGTYSGPGAHTIAFGRADPNRHIVIVAADMQGNAFANLLGVPTVNGVAASMPVNHKNSLANDGQRAGIFYASCPTGDTVDIVLSDDHGSARFNVYRMVGVTPGTAPTDAQYVDGDTLTLTHPAGPKGGCVFVAGVQNWADFPAGGIDGCASALTIPATPIRTTNICGANLALPASNVYKVTQHGGPILLMAGVTFPYNA